MTSPTDGRRSFPVLVLILGLTAAAVGVSGFPSEYETRHWFLIKDLSQGSLGEGRLYRDSPAPPNTAPTKQKLIEANLEILSPRESYSQKRIQSLLQARGGDFQGAIKILTELQDANPYDAEVLNDLGVMYMALDEENAVNSFRAANLFEQARHLTVSATAPSFNLAIASRRIGFDETVTTHIETPGEVLAKLTKLIFENNRPLARDLLSQDIARYRKAAVDLVLNPPAASSHLGTAEFILEYCEALSGDRTLGAMISPLRSSQREMVVRSRTLIAEGMKAYQQGNFPESSRLYDRAYAEALGINSPLDILWIRFNQADTALRMGQIRPAGQLLDGIIAESRQRGYKWLLAKALTAKGSDSTLFANYEEVLQALDTAITTLMELNAPHDAARAMYYVATARSIAGDFETSLDIAYRALQETPKDEYIRRAQLYWLAGLQVYRLGFPRYGIRLEEMALREAEQTHNPVLLALFLQSLATMHADNQDTAVARKYVDLTEEMFAKIRSPRERALADVFVNLLRGRLEIETGDYAPAEELMNKNIQILTDLPIKIPDYFVQTLLQLAEVYSRQGRFDLTRQKLREAAEVIETNDVYLAASTLRTSFENERRNFYDKAISFEFNHAGKDAAWGYAQEYRSKLFLEFLKQMNPGVLNIKDEAIYRGNVQHVLPDDVQLIEYVMLRDQLLIWVVSSNRFFSIAVPIGRATLSSMVSDLLQRIENRSDIQKLTTDLHRILIDPIEDHLDPKRALAIIPDQALHRLNFPALYSSKTKSFLIERYALLGNPSLTSLLSTDAGVPARTNIVAFGAQTDDTNASQELKELRKYYTAIETFNGTTAVKPAFLSSMPTANIFHYAGHSQDASDPLRSAILLDGNNEGANSVTAVDITKVKMPPNSVVVLASCDSSVGNSRDGVGMRGLTSAFLISGAGSVVGSLWLVEAKSTSRLVLSFHKHFAQDRLSVAEALRKAQLESIKEGQHPYYWSGFVATGNLSALK